MSRAGWNVLTIAVAVLALFLYGSEQRKRGAAEAQGARWKHEMDSLAKVAARVDTVFAGEKKVYAGWRVRWDTARVVYLERALDSLREAGVATPETVKVEVPVAVLVTADSTIRSCSAALLTCEKRDSLRLRQLETWQRRWDAREKPPSAFRQWSERIAIGLLAYELGRRAP